MTEPLPRATPDRVFPELLPQDALDREEAPPPRTWPFQLPRLRPGDRLRG